MIEINNHLLVIISSVLSLYIFNFLEQSSTSYHCWTKSGLLPLLVKKKKKFSWKQSCPPFYVLSVASFVLLSDSFEINAKLCSRQQSSVKV